MILWCLQSHARHEKSWSQWQMCLLLCFVHSYSIEINAFVWFFSLYSCQTTQKWQATNRCTHYILAKAIAILLHSTLIRISSSSILIYTFSGITGTCYGFRLKLFGVKFSLTGQFAMAVSIPVLYNHLSNYSFDVFVVYIQIWFSSLSLFPDFSFSGKTTKIIILSVAFPQSLLF